MRLPRSSKIRPASIDCEFFSLSWRAMAWFETFAWTESNSVLQNDFMFTGVGAATIDDLTNVETITQ
jgi:hypothetical protein